VIQRRLPSDSIKRPRMLRKEQGGDRRWNRKRERDIVLLLRKSHEKRKEGNDWGRC